MKEDKVIFKDFGKNTTDKENRDENLKAYICSILDVPGVQFDDIIKHITTEKEKEAFINMINDDIKGRVERFFKERD
jgi:hypothetical protein